jgi:hypothetical protein
VLVVLHAQSEKHLQSGIPRQARLAGHKPSKIGNVFFFPELEHRAKVYVPAARYAFHELRPFVRLD